MIASQPTSKIIPSNSRFAAPPETREMLKEMNALGGHETSSISRLMLHPGNIDWKWEQRPNGEILCQIRKVGMAVLGAEITFDADGREDRQKHENDERFAIGRQTAMLTRHYDTIARSWPVFERTRQLVGLVYALNMLRELGYQPSAQIRQAAHSTLRKYLSRGRIPEHHRLRA